jgi:uroporphyrinogen-III synthase
MRPLVILRPEPAASATATRARAMGVDARAIPLFEIVPLLWEAPDPAEFDAIVMTSANAPLQGGEQLERLKSLPVRAVGAATAGAAREAGFSVASIGEGGSGDMVLTRHERLLHLAGREHRAIGAALTIPVYEARPIEPAPRLDGIGECVAAVYSPRAGRRLAWLVAERSRITIAAISTAAAEACEAGWNGVHAAPQPNDSALLALAARLCDSPTP